MTFKLLETQQLQDIQSEARLYEHQETGAQVLRLANDDTNKAFTIAFRTPPTSDNGIAHILEHSVLNGSKKYPSKEPFVELIKGSLNTFVNAMTFSDKTIYPVASTNEQDFQNLMSVYLDAVFQPNFRENPQILAQEGWHYHLENAEDDLIYKGVVYNEMKGANASPDRQLANLIQASLYPNTTYAVDSGGSPAAIPDLTQDEFIAFHDKYYHPSNSLTILYGDLNEEVAFDQLTEYFDGMGQHPETVDLAIEAIEPSEKDITATYSLSEGDNPKDKDYLALNWHVNDIHHTLDYFGLSILLDILFGNNESPLKKALLDAEIGGDITPDYSEVGYVEAFSIIAKFSNADRMDDFKRVVQDTLEKLVKEGIPTDLIEASLNKHLFHLKEAAISESNPRGVIYAIESLSTWLYGDSPYERIEFSEPLAQLKELSKEGYFEQLIERKLLNNSNRVAITLVAEPGKNDRQEAEVLAQLKEFQSNLNDEEIQHLVNETQALISRQETPDSAEDLAKIPRLTREDLTTETSIKEIIISDLFENTQFNHADEFTSGIDYLNLYLDLSDFAQDDFQTLGVLSRLMGKLPTQNYSIAELQTQIDLNTGGISAGVSVYENIETGEIKPYLSLSGKALENSVDDLIRLMKEVLCHTNWYADRDIYQLLQSFIASFDRQIDFSSHALAATRALSQVKINSRLSDQLSGLDQYKFLLDTRQQFNVKNEKELIGKIEAIIHKLLNKQRIHALYVGDSQRVETIKDKLLVAFNDLPAKELDDKTIFETGTLQKEAFITAQDVNYVAQAVDTKGILPYSGSTNVLATLLRFDYLWNSIRVKGGAYGAMFQHNRSGSLALVSYRDPNIAKTIEAYQGIPTYIENLKTEEDELFKTIIGTMSNLDQPLSAYHRGIKSFNMKESAVTENDIVKLKEEILATTTSDLTKLSAAFKTALENPATAIIGNKAQIEAIKDRFDTITELY
ncbi:peptidase M16 [Aerococcaceae bacterium DSM 109653]|uniref:Peptidase M16 n=1 Tax=Fundicoccus ignavus TaxID=2664442 RepID=A0A844BVH8_9LACT|nr:insulinase family protein [Fundicoccus ignavus]MRI80486.1 peptidase M16 [Fundicoccus ignavus]